jgi:hypothetical protein
MWHVMGKALADASAAAVLPHYNMWDPKHERAKWDVFSYGGGVARSPTPMPTAADSTS